MAKFKTNDSIIFPQIFFVWPIWSKTIYFNLQIFHTLKLVGVFQTTLNIICT